MFLVKNKNSYSKYLVLGLMIWMMSCIMPTIVWGANQLNLESYQFKKPVLPNNSHVDVLYLELRAEGKAMTIRALSVINKANYVNADPTSTKFESNGINKVSFYKEDAYEGVGYFGEEDQLLGEYTISSLTETVIIDGINEVVNTTNINTTKFWVVFDISEEASPGTTSNITLDYIEYDYVNDLGGTETKYITNGAVEKEFTVSGFDVYEAYDIAPDVAIPGQGDIPILRLAVKVKGESVESDIKFTIKNIAGNYVTTTNSTNGVITAKLYQSTLPAEDPPPVTYDPDLPTRYKLIKTVNNGDDGFATSSSLEFEIGANDEQIEFPDGVTQNFYVIFEIGEGFQVAEDSRVKARLDSVQGTGQSSSSTVKREDDKPDEGAVEIKIAGLVYANLAQINVRDSIFGGDTIAPLLKFDLKACNATIDVQALMINSAANGKEKVPFAIGNREFGIKKILIYEDTVYDGWADDNGDTKIGEITCSVFGYPQNMPEAKAGNNETDAVVTLNVSLSNELEIGMNQTKHILVLYHFGTDVESSAAGMDASGNVITKAVCRLGGAIGTSKVDDVQTVDVSLSGTLPAAASPEAEITIKETNVNIIDIRDIKPASGEVLRGQSKVPMLYLELSAESNITNASLKIKNTSSSFSTDDSGVTRIWIYRDKTPLGILDETDDLLGTNGDLDSTSEATITGISFLQGTNRIFVCYDIGQIAEIGSNKIACQLSSVTSGGAVDLAFGGLLPAPYNPSLVSVIDKRLEITSVTSNVQFEDNLPALFNVYVRVKNLYNDVISLLEVTPRFFLAGVNGEDISSEFTVSLSDAASEVIPTQIDVDEELEFMFDVAHSTPISGGMVLVDGYTKYKVIEDEDTITNSAVICRYQQDTEWFAAAKSALSLSMQAGLTEYAWSFPEYIEQIKVGPTTASGSDFQNGDAVRAGSSMFIYMKNLLAIDENTFAIMLNGETELSRSSEGGASNANSYSYNRVSGIISIYNIGYADGLITLNVRDPDGYAKKEANIEFRISSEVEISDLLFYPNPYQVGVEDLKLGFNITQPAKVTVYLFNHLGINVWRHEETFASLGPKQISIDRDSDFFRSGMYVCKMVAVDENGQTDTAVAKLAIY
jgi:hypothetical protein